ncbi:hypothetical protein JY651_05165 [Pyxidicoccus parkwayensis]|uniref:Lipoprotein n=1 Tax=Pyxidicoccus parkwayensis TaxID=2813578 RepID=A0ABX7NZJ9_9BACT|nr:hypothetical protein [Pyxidicoccus parkwaysis]QSQ24356.1 hypothetical protein JY651_05165 [Pyxidicoccus parkwaysis]
MSSLQSNAVNTHGGHDMFRIQVILLMTLLALPKLAAAEALSVVNVGAPAINCVFDTSCTRSVTDTSDTFSLPGSSGTARLQSRTFTGATGAPAQGYYGYEYVVDMSNVVGITNVPCIQSLRVSFGPVASFQYNGTGPVDQVYVVSSGGSGTIGLSSANKVGNEITFTFATPVCAGGSPGAGARSFFFGLASASAPTAVTAVVVNSVSGTSISVGARAPIHDKCTSGIALAPASDPCVSSVCAADAYCCSTSWDNRCVGAVRTVCGSLTCSESDGTCGHSLCTQGASLVNHCDSAKADCVSAICAVDSFCCSVSWDSICVSQVGSVCGKTCQ